jgi:hypothetical protein
MNWASPTDETGLILWNAVPQVKSRSGVRRVMRSGRATKRIEVE